MVRSKNRKLKDYSFYIFTDEDYDDEHHGVITDADGNLRTARPGEIQDVPVDEALSAAQAAHPEPRDPDEQKPANRQRASSLAHTADLTVPATGSRATTSVVPAHTAGPQASTPTATTTTLPTSPSSSRPKDPRKPKRIVHATTTSEQPSPAISAADPPAQQSSPSTGTTTTVTSTTTLTTTTTTSTKDHAMDSTTAPECIEASPTPPQCLAHTADTQGAKSSYVAHTAAMDAGGAGEAQEILSVPPPPPGTTPSTQSGKDVQKRSTSKRNRADPSQCGKPTAGKSRREPKQFTSHAAFPAVPAGSAFHRTHRLETWEACIDQLRPRSTTDAQPSCRRAPATDALRASQPRRRPRADPFDQKLTAPRRCSSDANEASKSSSATHCHATRAAQEPLEPLAPATKLRLASPSPCAFCGNDHVSYVCDVYKSVAQRLGRTRHLERCFSCLGQGHHSSSCSKKDAVCSICRSGHHHEAFCRLAVASFALPAPCSGPPVPAPADTAPRMPTTRSARLKTLTTASHAAVALVTRRSSHKPSTTPDVNNNRRICAFCQSAHWTQKCTAFASVSQRLNRVRKLRLCFVCLQAGHSVSSCPSAAKPCKFCSKGSHHRALCCRDVLSHSTNAHVDGTHRKKRSVKATGIGIRAKNRNFCPPKNETICFCDAFVFHQFVRHLRPEVCLIPAPMFTSADAANVVCSFRPTSEVKRMLFWFSSDQVSLSHTELVHLVIQLSRYYTEYYESILQYVVVSPSENSRRDIWTYGIFKYLLQAQVLLPDARLTMLPHDRLVYDGLVTPNGNLITNPKEPSSCSVENIKQCMREHYALDLWNYYDADHLTEAAPATSPGRHAPPSSSATIAGQNSRVQNSKAATDARAHSMLLATSDAATSSSIDALVIAAPAASHHRQRGHSNRRRRRRDQGSAPHAHDYDARISVPPRPPNKDRERNQ